jgi:hypothetical protein
MKIDEFDVEVYKAIAAGLSIAAVFVIVLYILSEFIYPSPKRRDLGVNMERCRASGERCVDGQNPIGGEIQRH